MTREQREEQEAIEAFNRERDRHVAYVLAIRAGGRLADALAEPERLSPGSVGWSPAYEEDYRARCRRPKHAPGMKHR